MFRTHSMSQEDQDFEDRRDAIIRSFERREIPQDEAFKKLKGLGLGTSQVYEDLNIIIVT